MRLLILNSGGLDSALLAHKAHADGHEVLSLFIDFGTLNTENARAAARETAARYASVHDEARLDLGFVPTNEQYGDVLRSIPATSKLVASIGQAFGKLAACDMVWIGTRMNTTEAWVNLWNDLDDRNNFRVARCPLGTPIWDRATYAEAAEWAGVTDLSPFAYTVSCVHPAPCDMCRSCIDRAAVGLE